VNPSAESFWQQYAVMERRQTRMMTI